MPGSLDVIDPVHLGFSTKFSLKEGTSPSFPLFPDDPLGVNCLLAELGHGAKITHLLNFDNIPEGKMLSVRILRLTPGSKMVVQGGVKEWTLLGTNSGVVEVGSQERVFEIVTGGEITFVTNVGTSAEFTAVLEDCGQNSVTNKLQCVWQGTLFTS